MNQVPKEPYLPTLLMSNASTKQSCLKTFSAQPVKNGLNSFLKDYSSYFSLSFDFHFHLLNERVAEGDSSNPHAFEMWVNLIF